MKRITALLLVLGILCGVGLCESGELTCVKWINEAGITCKVSFRDANGEWVCSVSYDETTGEMKTVYVTASTENAAPGIGILWVDDTYNADGEFIDRTLRFATEAGSITMSTVDGTVYYSVYTSDADCGFTAEEYNEKTANYYCDNTTGEFAENVPFEELPEALRKATDELKNAIDGLNPATIEAAAPSEERVRRAYELAANCDDLPTVLHVEKNGMYLGNYESLPYGKADDPMPYDEFADALNGAFFDKALVQGVETLKASEVDKAAIAEAFENGTYEDWIDTEGKVIGGIVTQYDANGNRLELLLYNSAFLVHAKRYLEDCVIRYSVNAYPAKDTIKGKIVSIDQYENGALTRYYFNWDTGYLQGKFCCNESGTVDRYYWYSYTDDGRLEYLTYGVDQGGEIHEVYGDGYEEEALMGTCESAWQIWYNDDRDYIQFDVLPFTRTMNWDAYLKSNGDEADSIYLRSAIEPPPEGYHALECDNYYNGSGFHVNRNFVLKIQRTEDNGQYIYDVFSIGKFTECWNLGKEEYSAYSEAYDMGIGFAPEEFGEYVKSDEGIIPFDELPSDFREQIERAYPILNDADNEAFKDSEPSEAYVQSVLEKASLAAQFRSKFEEISAIH